MELSENRVTRRERFMFYRSLVEKVSAAYFETRHKQPVTAMNWDSQAPRNQLTHAGIHYTIDVRNAVEYALRESPIRAEQIKLFLQMGDGLSNLGPVETDLIEKLGRVFAARKLDPRIYFVPVRHPEHAGVSSIPDSAFMGIANAMAEEAA